MKNFDEDPLDSGGLSRDPEAEARPGFDEVEKFLCEDRCKGICRIM